MKRILLTAAIAAAMLTPAFAQKAAVKTDPQALLDTGLTVNECLVVLSGLNKMDEIERGGKPFEFTKGGFRLDISHNMAVLTAVQAEAQPAQQKIFNQIVRSLPPVVVPAANGKPETTAPATSIPPGTDQALEYDRQLRELTNKPCRAVLTRIKAEDLNLDKNQIPLNVLSALDRILDR